MPTTIAVARYLPSGELDDSFGAAGVATLSFPGGVASPRTVAVRAGRSDSIAVCCDVGSQLGIARMRANGEPDSGFGSNGRVVVPFMAGLDRPTLRHAIFAQNQPVLAPGVASIAVGGPETAFPASSRIIVMGRVGGTDEQQLAAVAQYTADGRPDRAFSTDGETVIGFTSNRFEVTAAAFSARQNRICVIAAAEGDILPTVHLACLSLNGRPDESFGTGGRIAVVFAEASTVTVAPRAAVIQPDTITLAGSATASDGGTASFALARVKEEGGIDRDFGDGLVLPRFNATPSAANSVAIDARGRIVAAGFSGSGFGLTRFLPNGRPDARFSRDGLVTTGFDEGRSAAHIVRLESPVSERMVVAGGAGLRFFALARYLENGSLDPTFGVGGKVSTAVAREKFVARALDIAFDGQGRIVAAGPLTEQIA
jgi:uncharacterized delta-60 repeat protein